MSEDRYDTRRILEQMKEDYWRSISEAEAEEVGERLQIITFVLGGELYAVETAFAKEIIKIPPMIKVPRTPPFLLGIMNLRGTIISLSLIHI